MSQPTRRMAIAAMMFGMYVTSELMTPVNPSIVLLLPWTSQRFYG
jgi:hypothetical protein